MLPRAVVVTGWLLFGPLLFAACGDPQATSIPSQGIPTGIRAYEPDAADAGIDPPLATSAPAPTVQGNALCSASHSTGTCYPDDLINACDFAPDSSARDADIDGDVNIAPACHVVSDVVSDGGVHTECMPSIVAGMSASSCSRSGECSPGYECVSGGTCRHYCCAGNSSCADNQFCDVQPVAESPGTLVPVCMTRLPCQLLPLNPGDEICPPDDQCSVVRDTGETSCVPVGSAQDGASCDRERCDRGLLCLGALGSRRCAPLCYTMADPLGCKSTGRACVGTLPLFQNPAVGVCQ